MINRIKCLLGKHKFFAKNIAGLDCYVHAYLKCVICDKTVNLFEKAVTKNRVKWLQDSSNSDSKIN